MEKSISVSSILWKNELRIKNLVYLFDIISINLARDNIFKEVIESSVIK